MTTGTAHFLSCIVEGNYVSGSNDAFGGGFYIDGDCVLEDCRIRGNTVFTLNAIPKTSTGGGLCVADGTCSLTNCVVENNSTTSAGRLSGIGEASGGGIAVLGGNTTIENVILSDNFVSSSGLQLGAGVCFETGSASCTNVTIVGNRSAAALEITAASVTVRNSIIYDNPNGSVSGAPTIEYSDVDGGYSGTGNSASIPVL
jgi:hypothetical protein